MSAYVIPVAAASSTVTTANQFLDGSCGVTALFCGGFDCTFSATRALTCGGGPSVTLAAGSYSVIGRICVPNNSDKDVCDEMRIPLTVN